MMALNDPSSDVEDIPGEFCNYANTGFKVCKYGFFSKHPIFKYDFWKKDPVFKYELLVLFIYPWDIL